VTRALILGVTLAVLSGCGTDGGEPPPSAPSAVTEESATPHALDSPAMQFLPREEEVEGWRLASDPSVYPAAFLDEYVTGIAEDLGRYDLLDLTVGEYEAVAENGFATVEIYRFPDFVQSFGTFTLYREPTHQHLPIQDAGFYGRNSLHVWRGPFYVRVLGIAGDGSTLENLASAVVRGMPSAPGLPAALRFLPVSNRIEHSEKFLRKPVFGQPFLSNSFVASFRIDNQIVEGLVLPAPSREAATLILNGWRDFYERNGRLLDPVPNLGEDNFTGEEQFAGRTVAFRIDRFVVIFRGFTRREPLLDLAIDADRRIIRTIQDALRQTRGSS
jgi:hypothetical protein